MEQKIPPHLSSVDQCHCHVCVACTYEALKEMYFVFKGSFKGKLTIFSAETSVLTLDTLRRIIDTFEPLQNATECSFLRLKINIVIVIRG